MIELNKVYEQEELCYWCNSLGEINDCSQGDNGYPMLPDGDLDVLPLKVRNLYEHYWGEDIVGSMYVVEYKGEAGIALGWVFDESWCADIANLDGDASLNDMNRLWLAVKDFAEYLSNDSRLTGCYVFPGNYTDPIGHEIIVYIPYCMRDKIKDIVSWLPDIIYDKVRALF